MKQKTFHKSYNRVFNACKEVLNELGLSVNSADSSTGTIQAKKAGGLLSYGNLIDVKVTRSGEKTIVKVSSESAAAVQLIDWGTNASLEEDFITELEDHFDQ